MNCFNNNDNDAVVSCRSNQCNQIQPVASLHSTEWIMKNDANHSTNSSNISINNSLYNHQLSNQSLTKSITLSSSSSSPPPPPPPTTNHHNIQQSIDNQFTSFMMITSSQLNSQRKIYLIFQFIIYCLLCINISLCIVCFYAMEVNYQQFNVMNTTQTTFHYVLMNEVVSKLTDYLQEIINQGEFYTKQTFVTIEKSINKQLSITADRIIESLLEFYKLSSVIQTAESITQSINDTIIVSQIINSQQNVLQQDVNNYIGELYGYANLLNSTLNSICSQWNENTTEYIECKQLQLKCSLLLINVDTKLFELESSSVLVFLIRDLNIDLSLITNQFNVVQSQLDMKKTKMIQNIKSTFNLDSYQMDVLFVWQLIQQNVMNKLTSFLTIEKQYEIDKSLQVISSSITIIGYVIITFLLLLITLLLIYCILYTVDVYQRKLFTKQHLNRKDESFKSFTLKIHGEYKKNTFQLQLHRLFYLPHVINKLHIKGLTTICLVTNSFLCLLLGCLFILFTLLLLIDTELCRYVNTEHGSELLDSIIDLYLKYAWRQIFTENVTILGNQINFPIPKKIYSTLRNQCQRHSTTELTDNTTNENYSFLRLLNYTKFINFNEILYSSSVQKKIDDAKRSSINEIVNMNYLNFIPNDISSLTTFPRKLSVYLDGKDYRLTINEMIKFTTFKYQLLIYLNESFTLIQTNKKFINLINILEQINKSINRYNEISLKLNLLINLFEKLQLNQNLTKQFDQIINGLYNFKNVTSDVKNLQEPITAIINASIQSLLNEMTMILNTEFDYLFSHLLPCDKFNKVLMTLLNVFCDRTQSIVLSLSSYIIIICITLL
ncbi:hypothetical protein EWB00_008402 [Schistosoma japonicum]|nr:hypothetical protein EWB00_008402 [Schistosoma japonicum]